MNRIKQKYHSNRTKTKVWGLGTEDERQRAKENEITPPCNWRTKGHLASLLEWFTGTRFCI